MLHHIKYSIRQQKAFHLIVEILSMVFIILLLYTGLSKLVNYNSFYVLLRRSALLHSFARPVSITVPAAEILIALLLIFPHGRLLGMKLVTLLFTAFTLYISVMLLFTNDVLCTCGGMLQKLSWPGHIAFNLISVLLSIAAIIIIKAQNRLQSHNPP